MKLSDALQGFWLSKELEFSEQTIPGYRRTFARLVAFLGDVDIEAVTSADIRRYLLHLKNDFGLGKRTVSDAWVPLSSLWTWAEAELTIPHIIRGVQRRRSYFRPGWGDRLARPCGAPERRSLALI